MTRGSRAVVFSFAAIAFTGCTSHLVFFEEDHLGLKAAFEANNPTPAQVSVGYRRGVVAVIPQQMDNPQNVSMMTVAPTNAADGTKTATVTADAHELMSMYTTFSANIGFGDPLRVNHFLATGMAAASLLADDAELRNVAAALKNSSAQKGAAK